MTPANETGARRHLEDAYCALCPQRSDQRKLREMVDGMLKDGETEIAVCKSIMSALHFGIFYNEWPSAHIVAGSHSDESQHSGAGDCSG